MAEEDRVNSANILVGCGGSGVKTLIRLNELLSQDTYWRNRITEDFYYIIVDTELASVRSFKEAVANQIPDQVLDLTVETIRLSKGVQILQPDVQRYFINPYMDADEEEAKGQKRLLEHWWHRGGGKDLYKAPRVNPVTKGAGQCPPVSYFLAWKLLGEVEQAIEHIYDEIAIKKRGQRPDDFNLALVTGLAGGTGRGCWQLIAFKIRQYLGARGIIPKPTAYLFDASVFENIMESFPVGEEPMRTNSLTGISELSCWIRNVNGNDYGSTTGDVYRYNLPDMRAPAHAGSDVLDVDLALNVNSAAPVDTAYLVFRRGAGTVLETNDQAHEMVGGALYAAITKDQIDSQSINQPFPYNSLATATFEVNAVAIRHYFKHAARVQALNTVTSRDDEKVNEAVGNFLVGSGLRFGVTSTDRSEFKADDTGTFLQKVCHAVVSHHGNALANLDKALVADDVDESIERATTLCRKNESAVLEAIKTTLEDMDASPVAQAKASAKELYKETGSVGNISFLLDRIEQRILADLKKVPSTMAIPKDADLKQTVEKLSTRTWGVWGPHFDQDEREVINRMAARAVLLHSYEVIVRETRDQCKRWLDELRQFRRNAEAFVKCCEAVLADFDEERHHEAPVSHSSTDDELFESLFAPYDKPEEGIPKKFLAMNFYRRPIKPVLTQDQAKEMLPQLADSLTKRAMGFQKSLREIVMPAVFDGVMDSDSFDAKEQLQEQIKTQVVQTVHLPYGFVEDNFSLRKVVTDLRKAWLSRFDKASDAELNKLMRQFTNFFGVTPGQKGEKRTLPNVDQFLIDMAASLASICKPWWQLSQKVAVSDHTVTLFIPPSPQSDSAQAFEDKAKKTIQRNYRDVRVNVFVGRGEAKESVNVFLLLAYSQQGCEDLDDIASLGYWSEGDMWKAMVQCESTTGDSVVRNDIGYTDPLYVNDERIIDMRWRPWMANDETGDMADINKTLDAMWYALLDPDEKQKDKFRSFGWEFPLVRDIGKESYRFVRKSYSWNDQPYVDPETKERDPNAQADDTCPWKTGQMICTSIWQVFDVLHGRGNKAGKKKKEGPEWRDWIQAEAKRFWRQPAARLGMGLASDEYKRLLRSHMRELRAIADNAKGPEDKEMWVKLVTRLNELVKSRM